MDNLHDDSQEDGPMPQPQLTPDSRTHQVPVPDADTTPMMAQFMEIKAANPDSLLFYRMGDFYEMFFEDAATASRALGITLTKRGKHQGQDIPMCGVPVHAADDYLQKLIGLGYRVAVCEQMEDPAEAKKRGSKAVVRRDVTRLVTAATITEEKLLDPHESSYLVTIARIKASDEMAMAWVDISTGTFRLMETAPDRLMPDIMRVAPKEIIVAQTLFDDGELRAVWDYFGRMVSPQPASMFDSASAPGRLARFFDVSTTDGFGNFSRAELAAASAAIGYVEKTQIAERPALQIPQRETNATTLFIDAATRANLELERTLSGKREGSLLKAIDRTVTGGGARLLAERLRAPLTGIDAINARLDAVSYFVAQPDLGDRLVAILKAVPDMPRALSRLSLNRGGPRDLAAIAKGLEIARDLGTLLEDEDLPPELAAAKAAIGQSPVNTLKQLKEAMADELPLLARDGGFVRAGHDAQLDELRLLRDQSRRIIAGLQNEYARATGVKSLKIRHNNVLGYFIEVTALNAGSLTDSAEAKGRFIHRQTLANAMRFTTTELAELETKIANAAGQALTIELGVFDQLREAVIAVADKVRAVAEAIAVMDVCTALADLAQSHGYCRPIVDDSVDFEIVAGRHPVVEQAIRRMSADPFVANDCDLSPQGEEVAGSLWLLTGPNMGGKSTFLRQNALIAIMAQMGSFVPAGAARIGVVDRLFSRVGASDDLARGRSTFMVEMVETAAILNQASERSLVILDEIGRGTSTFDGLSIAWAAVEYLHEQNKCRTLFATHFHELTALSEKLIRLANVTMRVKEWDGDVVFLHEVAKGAADRSYGVQVAKLAGLPEAVVERARDVLEKLETQDQSGGDRKLIDDLPLFSVPVRQKTSVPKGGASAIEAFVGQINPDELTPREALELLYKLKALDA